MCWPERDRRLLMSIPGLGPDVIERLSMVGIDSLAALKREGADRAVERVCRCLGNKA